MVAEESVTGWEGYHADSNPGRQISIPSDQVYSIEIGDKGASAPKSAGAFVLGTMIIVTGLLGILCMGDCSFG